MRSYKLASRQKLVLLGMVAAIGSVFSGAGLAQSDTERIRDLERKLEQSLKTIEELAARLKEVEASIATRTDAAQSEQAARADDVDQTVSDAGPAANAGPSERILRGFVDVGASYSGNRGRKGFNVGSFDLYLTPELSDNVKTLVEVVFELESDGEVIADPERIQIGYTFTDAATVWAGRFHTPFGYWNTAFHHGQQIQTSVLRPKLIDFEDEGGILPTHTVGLWGTGSVRSGNGRLTYDLYTGNSPSVATGTLTPNPTGNSHPGLGAGFNVGYRFDGPPDGLKVGVHGYRTDVRDDSVDARASRVNLLGGYAAIDSDTWDMVAEYYRFRDENLSGTRGHYDSWAGFAQIGRHFGLWTPYARLEKAALDQGDNYFALQAGGRSYSRQSVGLRYNLTPESALKMELGHTVLETSVPARFNELHLQWAIRF